jgi:hypothetical protein
VCSDGIVDGLCVRVVAKDEYKDRVKAATRFLLSSHPVRNPFTSSDMNGSPDAQGDIAPY